MTYFESRDLAGITIFAALWGVLNVTVSPVFFTIFHLPFLCDLIGFASIILAIWWTRKLGTASLTGFIATVINFMRRPGALYFLGFTAASVLFDVLTALVGYKNVFKKQLLGMATLFSISVFSAATAGLIIGAFFMPAQALVRWGGVLGWAGLHAVGGVLGGALGVSLTSALIARGVPAKGD